MQNQLVMKSYWTFRGFGQKYPFEKAVYLLDDKKASEIAWEKYSRQHQGICNRAGTMPFSVLTDYGDHFKLGAGMWVSF